MTTPHERDRSLEQWLANPRTDGGEPTDACLDAETVAAWLDGGLDTRARQQAEAHVSSCARCQALAGAIVRTEAAEAASGPTPSPWRAWLNWAVPLGAVAAAGLALAVWLNVPAPPLEDVDAGRAARVESPSAPAAAPPAQSVPAPAVPEPQLPPSEPTAAAQAKESERASNTVRPAEEAPRAKAAAPSAAAATPRPAAPPPAPLARAAAPSAADAAVAAPPAQEAVAAQAFAGRPSLAVEVQSPDGQVRWRLAGRGLLRSADGGVTWTQVLADAGGRLTAGSAPSPGVCWAVGEGGLVWRAVDGAPPFRVASPVAGDLTSVLAQSATSAVVVASDGRRFATADAGATWTPVR